MRIVGVLEILQQHLGVLLHILSVDGVHCQENIVREVKEQDVKEYFV
jgi:hypothetical protein